MWCWLLKFFLTLPYPHFLARKSYSFKHGIFVSPALLLTLHAVNRLLGIARCAFSNIVPNVEGLIYHGTYGGEAGRPATLDDVTTYGDMFYDVRTDAFECST